MESPTHSKRSSLLNHHVRREVRSSRLLATSDALLRAGVEVKGGDPPGRRGLQGGAGYLGSGIALLSRPVSIFAVS